MNYKIMAFSFDKDLVEKLKELRKTEGINLSHFVRQHLARILKARERLKK